MSNYLLLYSGGSAPESEEEGAKVMAAWGAWMGGLGEALVDGGNPMSGTVATVSAEGDVTHESQFSIVSGYSIISAESLDAAVKLAADCPIRQSGGSISVHETFEM